MTRIHGMTDRAFLQDLTREIAKGSEKEPVSFKDWLAKSLGRTNETLLDANRMIMKFSRGELKDIHQLMIAMEKASLSIELVIEIRNRMMEAYQEITRMQV